MLIFHNFMFFLCFYMIYHTYLHLWKASISHLTVAYARGCGRPHFVNCSSQLALTWIIRIILENAMLQLPFFLCSSSSSLTNTSWILSPIILRLITNLWEFSQTFPNLETWAHTESNHQAPGGSGFLSSSSSIRWFHCSSYQNRIRLCSCSSPFRIFINMPTLFNAFLLA